MAQVIEQPVLLIVGHGERGGAGNNARLATVAAKARSRLPGWDVRHGVLSGAPSIEAALSGAVQPPLFVWPFFICRGYFIDVTLRRRLAALGLAHALLQELGSAPRLVDVARRMLLADRSHRKRPVLVVAHGSSKGTESRLTAQRFARALAKAGPFEEVSCAFLDEPPFAKERVSALPIGSAVVSLFAGDGLHGGEDIADLVAQSGRCDLRVVCPAADTDAVADCVADAVARHAAPSWQAAAAGAEKAIM